MLPFLVVIPSLLATTALAAPAFEVPAILAPRQNACPTTSRWQDYSYSTVWLSTTTLTNGVSSLRSVTSTRTLSLTNTVGSISTVISPAVTTLPTTTTSPIVAYVTETIVWLTYTETVTSPGYAPTSACQVTTVTDIIPSTTSVTITRDLFYDTTWTSEVGHVSTKTEIYVSTTTRTVTRPGSTTYAVTVTEPRTHTSLELTFETIYSTVWALGCRSWACQL
ncbi:hypothetical protein MFIFM68171_03548 [Madurella fahalii]|uniref:Uncharacterized protein n=1 Tax=Madurella fahalii TaxID=1157608 RepID=A0ABQ0G6E9_9PEZI